MMETDHVVRSVTPLPPVVYLILYQPPFGAVYPPGMVVFNSKWRSLNFEPLANPLGGVIEPLTSIDEVGPLE